MRPAALLLIFGLLAEPSSTKANVEPQPPPELTQALFVSSKPATSKAHQCASAFADWFLERRTRIIDETVTDDFALIASVVIGIPTFIGITSGTEHVLQDMRLNGVINPLTEHGTNFVCTAVLGSFAYYLSHLSKSTLRATRICIPATLGLALNTYFEFMARQKIMGPGPSFNGIWHLAQQIPPDYADIASGTLGALSIPLIFESTRTLLLFLRNMGVDRESNSTGGNRPSDF